MKRSAPLTDLLEREPELASIAGALDGVAAGTGSFLVVEGPAGIGKTGLMSAARKMAQDGGIAVLSARGTELETAFGFGVVRQLFEPAVTHLSPAGREDVFEGAAAAAGSLLYPEDGHFEQAVPAQGADLALAHSLWWLTANLAARRPLLLLVDDAHWADEPSIRFLAYLRARVESVPVAVVTSIRTGEPAPAALAELADTPAVLLRLGYLSERAAADLAESRLAQPPSEAFLRSVHAATGGNPLLLNELLRTVVERSIPPDDSGAGRIQDLELPAVSRAFVRRIRRQGNDATELARALAVWGGRAELRQAAAAAGMDEAAAGAAADALSAIDILQPSRPLEFVHPLVRSAVYADTPAAVRAHAHGLVARMLLDESAPVERVGAHLLKTEPAGDEAVVDLLRTAARAALARGAPESAKQYLERALREPPAGDSRGRVLCKLGVAEMRLDPRAAVDHLEQAMDSASEDVGRAKVGMELIRAHLANGTVSGAEERIRPVVGSLEATHPELAMRLEAELIVSLRQGLAASPLDDGRLDRLTEGISGTNPSERMLLSQMAVRAAIQGAAGPRVAALAEAALGGGRLLADQTAESVLAYVPLYPLLCADRFDTVARYLDQALKDAAERGSPAAFALASTFRANLLLCLGYVKAAQADAGEALDLFRSFGQRFLMTGGVEPLVAALIETGGLQRAEDLIKDLSLDGPVPDFVPGRVLLATRGRLRLELGRTDDGLADLMELQKREHQKGRANLFLTPYRQVLAAALAASGRTADALELSRKELAAAGQWGPGRMLALNLIATGRLAGGEEGLDLLRRAVAMAEGSPARLVAAQAFTELGVALRRTGKRLEAIDLLRAGLDVAHRCGAEALVQRAKGELVVLGARPRRHAQSGAEALTPAERRVAELAAQGLTNRQIAESLFLTTRTVEHHLTATYQKLGITSRADLRL